MFKVSVHMDFSSAHNLAGYQGQCEELHGHNWKVEAALAAPVLDNIGMVEDFRIIKQKLKGILDLLDHKYLNDLPFFKEANPTSENIAKFIYERMKLELEKGRKRLLYVTVWETDRSNATYEEG